MKLKLVICYAAVASLMLFCGCGGEQKQTDRQKDVLTVWMPLVDHVSATVSNFGETELAKALQERIGVDIEFIHPPSGRDYEKFNLMVASADLPDVIEYNWLNYPGGPAKAIKEGVIIDISRHLDKAPNLASYLEQNKEIKKLATTDSGELFSFPFVRSDISLGFSSGIIIRGDWLESLGLDMPYTIDDWETVLTAFRDKKGAKTPYSNSSVNHFASAFNTTVGYYLENGRVRYGLLDESFRDYLVTMNRWYNEGLIDPNFATLDGKTYSANIINGRSGATFGAIGSGIGQMMANVPEGSDFSLEGAPVPVPEKGMRAKFGMYQLPVTSSATAFDAISTSCNDIDMAITYLDYGYSEEGYMLYNFGIEGESYNMIDGYPTYTKLITDNPDGYSMSVALARYTRSCYTGPFVQDKRYMEQYAALPQQKRAWKTWSDTDVAAYTLPHLYMKDDELTEYAHLNNDINTYTNEMIVKFIIGAEPMENYDQMIDELHRKGIDRIIGLMQSAYERYLAK